MSREEQQSEASKGKQAGVDVTAGLHGKEARVGSSQRERPTPGSETCERQNKQIGRKSGQNR